MGSIRREALEKLRKAGPSVPVPPQKGSIAIGASDKGVHLRIECADGQVDFVLSPEEAEDIAVELGTRAIEARNGGSLG